LGGKKEGGKEKRKRERGEKKPVMGHSSFSSRLHEPPTHPTTAYMKIEGEEKGGREKGKERKGKQRGEEEF